MAAVSALECLKRPVEVQVRTASRYVYEGVSQRLPVGLLEVQGTTGSDQDADLWQRLATASRRHAVEWILVSDDENDPGYAHDSEVPGKKTRADELGSAADDSSCEEPSIGTALEQFLAYRKEHCSESTFKKSERVVSTFKRSIDWYAEDKIDAIPASEIPGHFDDFYETLVHKNFASASELKAAKSVLSVLLKWLKEEGYLEAGDAECEIEDIRERSRAYTSIRKFVETLRLYVDNDIPEPEWDLQPPTGKIYCEYLRIEEIGDDWITFYDGWDGTHVGPVAVPPDLASMAQRGWEILLSAVKKGGEWRLLEVANGEP